MRAVWAALFIASVFIVWFFLKLPGYAHFADRPDLNDWAAHLRPEGGGLCCSFADAEALTDVEWDTQCAARPEFGCHYRVYLDSHWIDVPDRAVINTANKYGPAVVWPMRYDGKVYDIRCFIPGAGT